MNRRNRILCLALVVLGGLALALERPWQGDAFARTEAKVRRLFPELDASRERIAKVLIRSADRRTTLLRVPGDWVVEEKLLHPADIGRLIGLIDSLAFLDSRDVVSTNPDKQGTYSVEEGAGTRIQIWDEEERILADLVAGGLRSEGVAPGGPAILEFYVRPYGSDEVVLAPDFHAPVVDPADWLAGPLFPVEPDALEWIERQDLDGRESWKLVRGAPDPDSAGTLWEFREPTSGPAGKYAGDSFVFTFTGLRPQDVVAQIASGAEPDASYGFTLDVLRAGKGDQVFELRLGGVATPGARFAWLTGGRWIYTLSDFEVGQLRQTVEGMGPEGD